MWRRGLPRLRRDADKSRALLHAVKQGIHEDAQRGISCARPEFVWPTPLHVQTNEATGNHEVDNFMHDVEEDGEQKASAGIFDVELDAERGGAEPNHRFRDAVKPDGLMRERILQNADQTAGKKSRKWVAARSGETYGDQQRKIEDREKTKPQRQPRLQEDGGERDQNRRRNTEAVDLNLLARSVGDRHVLAVCPAAGVAAAGVAAAWVAASNWQRGRLLD